jgi:hypothetical protein
VNDATKIVLEFCEELPTEERFSLVFELLLDALKRLQAAESLLTDQHGEPHSGEVVPLAPVIPIKAPEATGPPELCCPNCGNTEVAVTTVKPHGLHDKDDVSSAFGTSDDPSAMKKCPQCKQRGHWIERPTGSGELLPGEAAKTASRPSECKHRYRVKAAGEYVDGTGGVKHFKLSDPINVCIDCKDEVAVLPEAKSEQEFTTTAL